VALCNPKTGDWSLILCTGDRQTIQVTLGRSLKQGPVYAWRSTAAEQFASLGPISLKDDSFEFELESDAIYTLTTTTGQQKGSHGTPPELRAFPFPFFDDFETYHAGDSPRYFSDQNGTFEVCRSPRGGMCLTQIVLAKGILWWAKNQPKPFTLFGDITWQDYRIEADVLLAGGDIEIGGRYANISKLGFRWSLARDGRWQLNWLDTVLNNGQLTAFDAAAWHHVRLDMNGDQVTGFVDAKPLATVSGLPPRKGMAFLASTYDRNLFDNLRVEPVAR
jgi:galactosylceramidase